MIKKLTDQLSYRQRQIDRLIYRISSHIHLFRNTQLIYGPRQIRRTKADCIVVSIIRDGEDYVERFIEHYTSLGVKHIVFLDNGSKDNTVKLASQYHNVTVLQCLLPYGEYKVNMRQFLIDQYSLNSWCILADSDEFFDYPYSEKISLSDLCIWLDKHQFNAVITHMLDMFPDGEIEKLDKGSFRNYHRWFEVESIRRKDLPSGLSNRLANSKLKMCYGGVRDRVFGNSPTLSKFSLIKPNFRLAVVGGHLINWAHIGDIECALYHYKFLPKFSERVNVAVQEGQYFNNSSEYKRYQQALSNNPSLTLYSDKSIALEDSKQLIQLGVMQINDDYAHYVHQISVARKRN